MSSTRAQAESQPHAERGKPAQPGKHTAAKEEDDNAAPVWCLAELERTGAMHPDSYKHAPAPKGTSSPHKRKDSTQDASGGSPPAKAARSSPSNSLDQGQTQVLRFLLSPHALPYTAPEVEASQPSGVRTYATARLTPFEELVAAVVLSRPVAHALGQRAIRTLLNPPYGLTTPSKARAAAGEGRVLEALREARTQHKEKTAEAIGRLADVAVERWGDGGLEGVREEGGWDCDEERGVLKEGVKGLGETGLDIFCRRVQWLWEEVYPFVDGRTKGALEQLGLPGEAEELRQGLESRWDELGVKDIGLKGEEEKKRRAFVLVLERAVGASLEKKVQDVLREAVKE
ncbi:hypothetical protein BFW01_g6695 [Lasiodiplodia theobromae]|uniref:Uncharacterized protein n=1 Tax=Lasiodiplodia theobromae TaxID=45133 RepID=A0A5N5DSS5_9PEZI|nr:hypothetical protein DBV05_g642 [Lasiodiplodia theobromae]KAF9635800.1 hypothetical protein BFW01_g6695 [Lasiodiplodia theobromae]